MSEPARPYIGGQAVIEGVMMRSPGSFAIVCRRKSGELVVREQPMEQPEVTGLRKLPFVRGLATVVESLRLGSRALRWSAELFEQDYMAEDDAAGSPPAGAKGAEAKREGAAKAEKASRLANVLSALTLPIVSLATLDPKAEPSGGKGGGGAAMILPIAFALFLFVLLPQAAAEGAVKLFGWKDVSTTSPLFQAITGGMKLCIVIGYLAAIRRVAEIRRVFEYHGAEHKTISTYEAGEPLVVENARAKTTLHPRCGTTFLVMVALVSIACSRVAGAFLPRIPGGRWSSSVGLLRHEAAVFARDRGDHLRDPARVRPLLHGGAAARAACGRASSCRRSPPPSPTTPSSRWRSRRCARRSGARSAKPGAE
jgi:uncharacterized protein YqhQ